MTLAEGHVGAAFGLVIAAGAATAIGASVVFFPALVKLASPRVLAASLSLAAGVMTYVSLVEILVKSQYHFEEAGHSEGDAYLFATVCFFAGVILMLILNAAVDKITGGKHRHDVPGASDKRTEAATEDPVKELQEMQDMASEIERNEKEARDMKESGKHVEQSDQKESQATASDGENPAEENQPSASYGDHPVELDDEKRRMVHIMGVNTALAVGLHNFPEGLATFVPALEDPEVGAVLAIAIGIHNIPEGLCVALPIYYATGSRWKAFGWALLTGSFEPLAGLFGWIVLANWFSDGLYATLFGVVSGMMVVVSIRELIPTAHKFDPEDTVVTYGFLVGAAVMALSLVLFVA